MKMVFFSYKLYLLSGFFSLFFLSATAQDTLQLSQAINIALSKSPDLQLIKNDKEVAAIYNSNGFAGGLPVISGNITDNEQLTSVNQKLNTGNTIQRKNAAANSLNAGVTGNILLYNAGRVGAAKKRLEITEKQTEDY